VQLLVTTMDAPGTAAVLNKIMATILDFGNNATEASGEAKDTAVNNLPPRPDHRIVTEFSVRRSLKKERQEIGIDRRRLAKGYESSNYKSGFTLVE
jgi:hypothetical protein